MTIYNLSSPVSWVTAKELCNDKFDTELASIHTYEDMEEASIIIILEFNILRLNREYSYNIMELK